MLGGRIQPPTLIDFVRGEPDEVAAQLHREVASRQDHSPPGLGHELRRVDHILVSVLCADVVVTNRNFDRDPLTAGHRRWSPLVAIQVTTKQLKAAPGALAELLAAVLLVVALGP